VGALTRFSRLRALPWLLLFEVARGVHAHVMETLSPADRRRVAQILRTSKGNPAHVTDRERADLKRIAGKLDLRALALNLGPRVMTRRK
jgi:hypothetical protein